ncbi:hypothetical protein GA0061078_0720 [Bifidobacterium bohemicum]|nr:hypothetical protein GA0061078_0720 [Bifidobacterium bohemicum]
MPRIETRIIAPLLCDPVSYALKPHNNACLLLLFVERRPYCAFLTAVAIETAGSRNGTSVDWKAW